MSRDGGVFNFYENLILLSFVGAAELNECLLQEGSEKRLHCESKKQRLLEYKHYLFDIEGAFFF